MGNLPRKKPKIHILYKNDVEVARGTIKQLAMQTEFSKWQLYIMKKNETPRGANRRVTVNLGDGEFSLYQGEKLVMSGTAEEIAEEIGVKPDTVRFYSTPTYMQRIQKSHDRLKEKPHYKVIELDEFAISQ